MASYEMFSSPNLQEEEDEGSLHEQLILSLPKQNAWGPHQFHLYQGFWYPPQFLRGVLYCQAHHQSLNSDILLVTIPKSGTTWLKAIAFSLVYRRQYPVNALHPLTTNNPHDLVPFIEHRPNSSFNRIPAVSNLPPPRLLASHTPFSSLPSSLRNSDGKIVYLCRDPRDIFISNWHFLNKFIDANEEVIPMEKTFESFCQGVSLGGPFWDHVLGYWKVSLEKPSRVLFLKYEDIKGDPESVFKRLADFLGCPFSLEEEKDGVVGMIVRLCSFENLSTLEVNRNGRDLNSGLENKKFFRRGEAGDWANHLTPDMSDRLLKIIEDKLIGFDLKF